MRYPSTSMGHLKPAAIAAYLRIGPKARSLMAHGIAAIVPSHRELEFYWSAGCPYSYLVAQR